MRVQVVHALESAILGLLGACSALWVAGHPDRFGFVPFAGSLRSQRSLDDGTP